MENKYVGWLVLGISLVIVGIIFLFNLAMKEIVAEGCPLQFHDGAQCPAYRTIDQQTYLSFFIVGILVLFGIVLIVSKPREKIIVRNIKQKPFKISIMKEITGDERKVLEVLAHEGPTFQTELIEKTDMGKAKMTRILDRLENRGYIERKRRGMTNIVVPRQPLK